MTLATAAGAALTDALKPQLKALVEDMRARLGDDAERSAAWRAAHQQAVKDKRTAASWTDYVEDQLTQAAVGWLLTSVFVRFCEDNLLLGPAAVWISGPTAILRQRARDAEEQFYRDDPSRSYREWLECSFAALRANPGTASLVDDHAAIGIMEPSSYAVEQLLAFWRRTDEAGGLVWRFDDPGLSTRFLGDLYQDLSDYAKKKYALLQTPEFVEEFILDQTMEPALKDRPLEGFKVIDPTCGSGHFLLGAFGRLVERWGDAAPGMDSRARVNKALEAVHGVDLNSFAVAIAKFRLIVAAMRASGDTNLVHVPRWTLNLATGDSLLHGPERGGQYAFNPEGGFIDADAVAQGFAYSTEDAELLWRLLTPEQYDVVVGNPPYITVKDKALNARYRERYSYCKGKYALTVPFMERFFELAKRGERSGWVGQITSNSFMKREFGAPIIEEFLARKDLRLVADTSGAYIPGHGTPTVIIIGRNAERAGPVHVVLGIQGEPGTPMGPSRGNVWSSIVNQVGNSGYEDRWISVVDLPRESLAAHPWSLSGGGAVELSNATDNSKNQFLGELASSIGITGVTGEDDVYLIGNSGVGRRLRISETKRLVEGFEIRDWLPVIGQESIWTYLDDLSVSPIGTLSSKWLLWMYRARLNKRKRFGTPMLERGLTWYEWQELYVAKLRVPMSITFAFVATHNHFVLDRGGKVFKQSAPVIKLPEGATEEDHLKLLGVLNSSTACFWLKQNSYPKGGDPIGKDGARVSVEAWSDRYEFTGTTLQDYPLPNTLPVDRAIELDALGRRVDHLQPAAAIARDGARPFVLSEAATDYAKAQARLIAEQEELDWEVYRLYGLIDEDLTLRQAQGAADGAQGAADGAQGAADGVQGAAGGAQVPGLQLGERAFEIALARRVAAGEVETEWFARHGSTPITEIPADWPQDYRDLVQRRLDAIEANPYIRLLEKPEYKRRWQSEPWEVKVQRALRDWLLDRIENPQLWVNRQGIPQPRSVGELAGVLSRDDEFVEALDLWAGRKDAPVAETLAALLADQAVPYLAAYRYKDSGLRKRAEWERVWDLQRAEDRGEVDAADIPVPPKYSTADFRKQSYWSHRGKLDVPKERFILYPEAGRATDPTPLLGWAGWNHAQQGLALANIFAQREDEGADGEKLIPIVAGIAELLPWVTQWHSGPDPDLGVDLAEYLAGQLQEKAQHVQVPVADLGAWRPPAPVRGRKKKAGA